jgi:hypothetical protein
MDERKFVYANIRVPIELKGDSFEICSDYMEIEFETCAGLPAEKSSKSDYHELLLKIFSAKKEEKETKSNEEKDDLNDEIFKVFSSDFSEKKNKARQNSSFRKKNNRTQQYTRRNYH